MKRESTVLLVVILALGTVFWSVRHWTDAQRAAATSFVFAIDGGGGNYRIEFHPNGADVTYVATLAGRHENGQMTAAAYQEFLRGFVQAGGQGLEGLALAQTSLLADLPTPASDTERAPALRIRVAPMHQPAYKPQSEPQAKIVQAPPPSYWYEVWHADQHQHFSLNPFDSTGRRLLSYLQSTVVFACYQRLSGS